MTQLANEIMQAGLKETPGWKQAQAQQEAMRITEVNEQPPVRRQPTFVFVNPPSPPFSVFEPVRVGVPDNHLYTAGRSSAQDDSHGSLCRKHEVQSTGWFAGNIHDLGFFRPYRFQPSTKRKTCRTSLKSKRKSKTLKPFVQRVRRWV
jgi:hypothetical protein